MEGKSGEIGFLLSPEIGEPFYIKKILLVEPFKTIGQVTINRVVRNIFIIFLKVGNTTWYEGGLFKYIIFNILY